MTVFFMCVCVLGEGPKVFFVNVSSAVFICTPALFENLGLLVAISNNISLMQVTFT